MDNVPPLDAVTFSVTRYNLWVACRLQSIGDMMKSEMERNRSFREEVRHSLVQLRAEVERLANNGNANNNSNAVTPNGNHGDDPRFDVSARISDMLGSTSASITEALLETDSQPASLLAPYGLIPPHPLAPSHPEPPQPSPPRIKREETEEIVVGEEDQDEEELSDEEMTNEAEESEEEEEKTGKMNGPRVELKVRNKKASAKSGNRSSVKNNYIDEWKKRRARELASARMRRFRERQKLKKENIMVSNLSSDY